MSAELRELIRRVQRFGTRLPRSGKSRVDRQDLKDEARAIVDSYFRDVRATVPSVDTTELEPIDREMQDFLTLTHRRTTVASCRHAIRRISSLLARLDATAVLASSHGSRSASSGIDSRVLAVLEPLVPSAAQSYGQALADLQATTRLSWRGPATDLREALRETLDHLAPDDAVTRQTGFKLQAGTAGPTLKQKVRYVLKKRGMSHSLIQTSEAAADAVEEAVGTFVRSVYTRSNVSTHTPTDKNEVLRIMELVRVVLCELLDIDQG